jgi:serine/threonine protein kinase
MAAFGTSNVSPMPPPNPFDKINTYINQLTPGIPKLDTISIFKSLKSLSSGTYGQAYANETHVMKMIDLEHQIKITRHNSYSELIKKITSSIQSEIVHYYAISQFCPNVCKMLGYSYDSINHKLYIYMEHCGKDLFDIYSYIHFPETIHYFIGQIISAVKCLHQNGFVHRDLKPENITVSDDGTTKLIDFGMARRDGDIAFNLGTPGYISPENTQPGNLTFDILKASDIWSLGVTIMFMLLTRALPPPNGSNVQNDIIIKLFSFDKTQKKPLTFVQRIEELFSKRESIFIMKTCLQEIVKIFGPSITLDSFFSDDWTKRANIEQLKTAFDNQTSAMYSIKPPSPPHSTVSSLMQKTTSKGGKSRREKRGSKSAKNHGAYKKPRSSRK